jgi:hypothetical protein
LAQCSSETSSKPVSDTFNRVLLSVAPA